MTAVLGFALIAFTLIVVPGPDWAYILAAGARDHVVVPVVSGVMVGYALITLVLVVGLGALVAAVPAVLLGLTVAGSTYLLYLGWKTVRSASAAEYGQVQGALASSSRAYFARGVGVSALNPKALLLFLSILPQFTRVSAEWPMPAQFAALGGIYIVMASLIYLFLGFAADKVLGSRPQVAQILTRVAGIAMICLGVGLIGEQVLEFVS
ncbi:LysE family translocator [Micrococcoides hystricis]|uniref:LysE family translocator n=2 Tax=Micrococcoides hystricis TaxID=1572761 RepID=A0ABV6PAD7_9MICC